MQPLNRAGIYLIRRIGFSVEQTTGGDTNRRVCNIIALDTIGVYHTGLEQCAAFVHARLSLCEL